MKYKDYLNHGFIEAYYSGVPIYLRDHGDNETAEVVGRNWLCDKLLLIVSWININIRGDEGFIFKIPIKDKE